MTTDPIISLDMLKQTFDINNYQVKTYKYQEPELLSGWKNATKETELPTSVITALKNMKDKAMLKEGKQYVELFKEDVKKLFSVELLREQQINKILI